MALESLNIFRKQRVLLIRMRNWWLRVSKGVEIDPTAQASLWSRFEPGCRGSITVGAQTLIAFKTLLYTFDPVSGEDRPIRIGRWCFIGGGSVIAPGVTIGDGAIIGAGSVVFDAVPAHSIVAGNPARVLRERIEVGPFGRLKGADDNSRRTWNA